MCVTMNYNGKEDISSSCFQKNIVDWFERRGMLSELRSHLRHQMITAFQNSSMSNQNLTGRFTVDSPVSPVLQAFLLLVAEFLAQQEYHYTVSILVAEVPILATFSKFSAHVSHLSDSQVSLPHRELPRYSEKDVLEILETLGISQGSESSYHILRLYMDSAPRESLLACILTALPAVAGGHLNIPETSPNRHPENLTYYLEEIRLLLLRAQLDKDQLLQLENVLRRFHACASAEARQEERAICLKEAEANNQQLRDWENAARQRQRNVEVELEASKRKLKAVSAQLCAQQEDVLRRLRRVQRHAEEVRIKEERVEAAKYENEQLRKHLESRKEQSDAQQARLEEFSRSLQKERDDLEIARSEVQSALQRERVYLTSINEQKETCANLQSELEQTRIELNEVRVELKATSAQTKIQPVVDAGGGATKEVCSRYTQTEVEEVGCSSSSVSDPASSSSSSELHPELNQSATKKAGDQSIGLGTVNIVRHLRQENAELQERNIQLQRRLEEVTEQAAIWASSPSRRVEPAVTVRVPVLPPPPPPPPPLPPPLHRRVARSCELGAGEELSHPPARPPSTSRQHTLHLHGREWKRSAPKQLLMHVDRSDYPSSDESVSEEVLRETGRRLRHLDAESELIDRRRKELKESSLTSTASYMFLPTATTPILPPPPAARSCEPGSITARLSLFPPERIATSVNFGLHDSTLGRYSQVTWPDVHGTSTPIRSYDNPLRRGVRSRLSLSRERRTTIASAESTRDSEERVPTSPLRSTERNTFLRLDAALDNIKLIREDLKRTPEKFETTVLDSKGKDPKTPWDPIKSVPNEERNAYHPSDALESPTRIRDRVMETLRASTLAVSRASVVPNSTATSSPRHFPDLEQRLSITDQQLLAQQTLFTSQQSSVTVKSSSETAKQSSIVNQSASVVTQQSSVVALESSVPAQRSLLEIQPSSGATQQSPVTVQQQSHVTARQQSSVALQFSSEIAQGFLETSLQFPLTSQQSLGAVQSPAGADETSVVIKPSSVVTRQSSVVTQQSSVVTQPSSVMTRLSSIVSQPSEAVTKLSLVGTQPSSMVTQPSLLDLRSSPVAAQVVSLATPEFPISSQQASVTAQPSPFTEVVELEAVESLGKTLEREVSPPDHISSSAMPILPLAPPVVSEKSDESPKDSTLNEIPTPASSPSISGKFRSQVVSKVYLEEAASKMSNNGNGSDKERKRSSELAEDRDERGTSKSNGELSGSGVKPLEMFIPKSYETFDVPVEVENIFPPIFTTNAETFADNSSQPPRYTSKDYEQVVEHLSLSSRSSNISAGSAEDLKDDSW